MALHTCTQGDPDRYQVLEGVRLKAESELRELATPDEWWVLQPYECHVNLPYDNNLLLYLAISAGIRCS